MLVDCGATVEEVSKIMEKAMSSGTSSRFHKRHAEAYAVTLILALALVSGCAGAKDEAGRDWRSIEPELKSSPLVDITSIEPHQNGWAAWTQSPVFGRDIPAGLEVPPDSRKWVRMHVDCRATSVNVEFLEARLIAPSGTVLHEVKKGGPGADRYPPGGLISYGISPPALICAAAAARCADKPLVWPLPSDGQSSFVPACKALK